MLHTRNEFRRISWLIFLVMTATGSVEALASGPWHAAGQNTSGWYYMTPDERIEHQRRMRNFDSYTDCRNYQRQHHAEMAQRAQQAGVTLEPRAVSACDQLRQRGKLQ